MDITAIGELLIDLTAAGTDSRGVPLYAANPGGAPANVAVAAARLGAETAFIGRVGHDYPGKTALRALEENGVDTRGVSVDEDAPTTLAIVSLDASGERSFQFYRDMCADTRLAPEHVPAELIASCRVLHFGSLSLTHESCRAALKYAIRTARDHGVMCSYDANYRPALWNDEAEAVIAMRSLLDYADIVKLSYEELTLLTGEDDIEAGTARVLEHGCRLVFITCGEGGAYWAGAGSFGHAAAIPVTVADTNGAGDSFMGAVLARLCKVPRGELEALTDGFLRDTTAFACRAAALTCTRHGAIPAMPSPAELSRL